MTVVDNYTKQIPFVYTGYPLLQFYVSSQPRNGMLQGIPATRMGNSPNTTQSPNYVKVTI